MSACADHLTAYIYTDMGCESVRSELTKLAWITEYGVDDRPENDTPKHALIFWDMINR
jgi:hypothetical protein